MTLLVFVLFLLSLLFNFLVSFSSSIFPPPSQSPCVLCGASQPQTSSPGSCPCSGRIWRSTWHAATPTQCPCATATLRREVAAATTPLCASAWQWNTTPHASRYVICHPTTASMSACHWPIQRGRKRAERSPSRLRRTVSPWGGYSTDGIETEDRKTKKEKCHKKTENILYSESVVSTHVKLVTKFVQALYLSPLHLTAFATSYFSN